MTYYYDNYDFDDESLFELYLIQKYLSKQYNEEEVQLLLTQDLSQLAYSLGENDIAFFCEYYLPNFFVPNSNSDTIRPLSNTHYEIFDELNKIFVDNRNDKQEFILPRGLGKSTVINKALSCWQHCYKKSRYTVVIGKREEDGVQFIGDTKQMLKSKKIENTFGILVDKKAKTVNKQELELTNNTKIGAFSSGTSIRGTTYGCDEGIFRPSIIITDDFISEADILTDTAKEKIVNKYYKEILEAGDKQVKRKGKIIKSGTKFLVIGTPLASDDFIATIKSDPEFMCFHRSVCEFDVDDYFTNNTYWQQYKKILVNIKNENRIMDAETYYQENINHMKFDRLWNDKWSCTYIANQYFTKRLTFMQELQCDCEKVGDIWIKYMAKMTPQEMYELTKGSYNRTILSIDQAASNNVRADYTAMTVLSKYNGFYIVRDGILKKFDSKTEFDKYIDFVIGIIRNYEDITHVVLEKNVYKGVDATRIEEEIAKDKNLKRRHIQVVTIYNTQNKDARISTITDKINSGNVIFNTYNNDYNEQVKDFRGQHYTCHDDSIDSLEIAINNIDQVKVTQKLKLLPRGLL